MGGLHTYDKLHEKFSDEMSFFGGRPLPDGSTIDYFIYLIVGISFVDTWLKLLVSHFSWNCFAYQDNMKELFKNIPTTKPTPNPE